MKHRDVPLPLGETARDLGVPLGSRQLSALEVFETLLAERAVPAGMVAVADAVRIRERHILDCLRAAAIVDPSDGEAYDLGSGAGLPGIVVAVARPELRIVLVEARARRAAFLELAVERLRLANASVAAARIEDLTETADLCFARALAPLPRTWALAEPLLRPHGRLVYFAGERSSEAELGKAPRTQVLRSSVLERTGPLVIMAR